MSAVYKPFGEAISDYGTMRPCGCVTSGGLLRSELCNAVKRCNLYHNSTRYDLLIVEILMVEVVQQERRMCCH